MNYNRIFKSVFIVILTLIFSVAPALAQLTNEAKVEYNKGIDFYNQAQYEKAVECFKNATELNPNYIDAYYNLGALLEFLNDQEGALSAFKQIILRQPDDYEAVYKAAEISQKLGDIDKMQMYLTIIPQDSPFGAMAKSLASSVTEPVQNTVVEEQNKTFTNGVIENIASPTGIATDNSGNLYVAGFSDNTIYKITPDNKKLVYIKDSKIDGPIGLAIDDSNNLYVANYNKNNILKIDKNGTILEIVKDILNPYCMHISKGYLFISSQGSNSIVVFKVSE